MDLEAPVDAWYVWLAVSIVSAAVAGIALGLPTGPPPDTNRAANMIEQTAGSSYNASATYDHDATEIKFDGRTLAMRNEHGTSRASLSYGHVVPVMGHERLENLTAGRSFEEEYAAELDDTETHALDDFLEDVEDAYADNTGEWRTADDQLRVRTISTTPVPTIRASVELIYAAGTTHEATFAYEANTDTKLTFTAESRELDTYIEKSVEASPSRETAPAGPYDFHKNSWLKFPVDVEIDAEGATICNETIRADRGSEMVPLCGPGGETIDITDTNLETRGYVNKNRESESFYVTLVSA
ncbi:hypothetical protein CP556_11715 [Natrinema sp. CBA1119]|uniref:DUF7283 family protein n=1 Tax=Natrinema sp. CBA1119 TaxID=1608465 RepID=UPI000BFA3A50|nr:hypothetical protein [Natrinema sp. CBA1119]PGF16718.1 hypothetical protein CP556_11715 [Natrinema sp. CBA1119]